MGGGQAGLVQITLGDHVTLECVQNLGAAGAGLEAQLRGVDGEDLEVVVVRRSGRRAHAEVAGRAAAVPPLAGALRLALRAT